MSCDRVSATLTLPTNYKGEHMKTDSIVYHLLIASGYTSVLKGVPYNKSNLSEAKWLVRKFNKCTLSDIRVRYRGKRLSHPNHTLKSEATHFDVYVTR